MRVSSCDVISRTQQETFTKKIEAICTSMPHSLFISVCIFEKTGFTLCQRVSGDADNFSDSEVSDISNEPEEIEFEDATESAVEAYDTPDSEPEGPYMDEPIANNEWLEEYMREVEEAEIRSQELQNRFDGAVGLDTW